MRGQIAIEEAGRWLAEAENQDESSALVGIGWGLMAVAQELQEANEGRFVDSGPDRIEMIQELREHLGLFAGAKPESPKEVWEETLERIDEMRSGYAYFQRLYSSGDPARS